MLEPIESIVPIVWLPALFFTTLPESRWEFYTLIPTGIISLAFAFLRTGG